MSLLLNNIQKHVSLTPQEQKLVLGYVCEQQIQPKEKLLKAGEVCTHSFFVTKGILRSYNMDVNGVEHVVSFACPGWWMADMYSFLSQRPGQLHIEANEATEVLALSRKDQITLFDQVPKMERFFRILIENSLVANQQRVLNNLSHTAEDRYAAFQKKYPELIHCLPQKQIASYIGVTPQFFSKMKARLLRGKWFYLLHLHWW